MYECDICGNSTSVVYVVDIEGARMSLCAGCAKGKNPVQVLGDQRNTKDARPSKATVAEEPDIADDYGKRIKSAREALGMPAKVLAERINEKESTLVRVESQRMLPSETLRKKLEKELGIRLIEQAQKGKTGTVGKGGGESLTLGDAAIKKDR